MINILSSDGEVVSIDSVSAKQSAVLGDFGDTDEALPLGDITSTTLRKIVEFCDHHRGETFSITYESKKNFTEFSDWDREFIKMETKDLFALIKAANFLNIPPLLNLGCTKVANLMVGKTPSQIQEMFNIDQPFEGQANVQARPRGN